jgi:hypothetical protein
MELLEEQIHHIFTWLTSMLVSREKQLVRQRFVTFFITALCILCGCAFVVVVKVLYGTMYAALAVTVSNGRHEGQE